MRLLVALFLPFLTAKAATVACDPNTPVNWSVVQPGDTIQLASGNYSGGFKVQKSGTADKPIVIKGPASGTAIWKSGWDVGTSSYVTIDGDHAYGIKVDLSGGTGGPGMTWGSSGNVTNLTVKFMELIGTPKTSGVTWGSYGMNFAPGNYDRKNMLISHCRLYQWCEAFRANQWKDCVIEYNEIRKTQTDNIDHSDIIYSYPSENVTWRYNVISESPEDGMFHEFGGAKNFKFYGNVYWNTRWHMIFFKATGTYGPVYFWNNVFAGKSASDYGYISKSSSTMASGTQVRNNIFLNVTNDFPGGDYNCYVPLKTNGYDAPKEPHGIVTATNPFVNSSAGDFHLSAAGKTLLAGKGSPVPEILTDMEGTSFNAEALDIGAFAAGGGGPSPTPSATPTPSTTPEPTPTPPPVTVAPPAPPSTKFTVGCTVSPSDVVNVRKTPAGTILGTQQAGTTGTVQSGPTTANFNGKPVNWWMVNYISGANGYTGEDSLNLAQPYTYAQWQKALNAIVAGNPPVSVLKAWLSANPPFSD